MKKKELKILGLSYSQTMLGSYVCVLSEKKGKRKIPIIIKTPEAQKIALEIEGIKSNKPMMHDVFKELCDAYLLDIQQVHIYALLEGVFYTRIIASNGLEDMEFEVNTGDGLALSVVFKCPIYCNSDIIDSVGIIMNDDGSYSDAETENNDEDSEDDFEDFVQNEDERVVSIEDLEKLMVNAIENEEYEIAAELRDRIQTIKDKKK